jgi:RHS repeat-associated protein
VSGTEDPDPLEQFVWHPYYIDALATRFYDAATSGTQTQHYFTHDANFNITAVVNSSGSVVERYTYNAYGQMGVLNGSFSAIFNTAIGNGYTYTGRKRDSETGLLYYRNRYYHAQLGNFVTRDPIGYAAGDANLYRYIGNGPTGYVDPLGFGPIRPGDPFPGDPFPGRPLPPPPPPLPWPGPIDPGFGGPGGIFDPGIGIGDDIGRPPRPFPEGLDWDVDKAGQKIYIDHGPPRRFFDEWGREGEMQDGKFVEPGELVCPINIMSLACEIVV